MIVLDGLEEYPIDSNQSADKAFKILGGLHNSDKGVSCCSIGNWDSIKQIEVVNGDHQYRFVWIMDRLNFVYRMQSKGNTQVWPKERTI